MHELSDPIISIAKATLFKRAATEQVSDPLLVPVDFVLTFLEGGLLDGHDPTAFNPSDPLRLWIVQVGQLRPIYIPPPTMLNFVLCKV